MFIDTSGLLCLLHRAEPQHADAVVLFDAAPSRLTHNYDLAEFMALAPLRGLPRREVLAFVADIQDDPLVEVVYVDESLHRAALNLLQGRLDKEWTLCSAIIHLPRRGAGVGEGRA